MANRTVGTIGNLALQWSLIFILSLGVHAMLRPHDPLEVKHFALYATGFVLATCTVQWWRAHKTSHA